MKAPWGGVGFGVNLGVELRLWQATACAQSYAESSLSEPDCDAAVAYVGGAASGSGTMVEMKSLISCAPGHFAPSESMFYQ